MQSWLHRQRVWHALPLRQKLRPHLLPLTPPLRSLIRYCKTTRDVLVPSVWGPVDKKEDPYAPGGGGCNCLVM